MNTTFRKYRHLSTMLVALSHLMFFTTDAYARNLIFLCVTDKIIGPDGQPAYINWKINIRKREACILQECTSFFIISQINGNNIHIDFTNGKSPDNFFELNTLTGAYLWQSSEKLQGTCMKNQRFPR